MPNFVALGPWFFKIFTNIQDEQTDASSKTTLLEQKIFIFLSFDSQILFLLVNFYTQNSILVVQTCFIFKIALQYIK